MNISWKTCFRVGLSIFFVYLCIYYWQHVSRLFAGIFGAVVPLVAGLAVAYVLNIVMTRYEGLYFTKWQHKKAVAVTKRPVCLTLALLTLLGIVALVVGLAVPELIACVSFLIAEIPPFIEKLLQSQWVSHVLPVQWLTALKSVDWMSYLSKILQFTASGLGDAVTTVFHFVTSAVSTMVTVFLSFIFAIYFLLSKEKLLCNCRRLGRRYVPVKLTDKLRHLGKTANRCFHRFLVGQCTEAVILGLLCFVGMWIFRFPYATMISVLIGFTALIPVAGAYIGAGAGALMILTESPTKALLFLLYIIVLQQLEGNLIYPKVVGDSLGLPAVFVLAAITVGGALGGVLGMLLGVPLTATVYQLIKENLNEKAKRSYQTE